MNWLALLGAIPATLWLPMGLAFLAPLVVTLARLREADGTVARRVAWLVAFQGSIGLVVLVLATAIVVFGVGLSQLSAPTVDTLAGTAADMERVRVATGGDGASLNGRLALLDAGDTQIGWSMIGRLDCTGEGCVVAHSPGIAPEDAATAHRSARRPHASLAWPLDLRGRVAMVVPVPLRDPQGTPDALLLLGLDATPVVRHATRAAWGMLGFTTALWLLLVVGTRRAVALSVGDRLRGLVESISSTDGAHPSRSTLLGASGDELQALARAVEAAAERSLRQETRLQALFAHAPVGIARLDPRGTVLAANPRFLKLLALKPEAPVPPWASVFVAPAEQAELERVLTAGGEANHASWTWRDGKGRIRMVRASVVGLPDDSGDPGAVLLVEDVSEQRALEAQLLRAQKMEVVGQLAGGIAHDFNNLLTVVRANVASLGGVTAAPELGAIDDAAARGGRLVRRLLTLSRNDMLTATPQTIGPILFETVEMVRRVLPSRIRIEAPAEAPACTVRIDRDAVQQALLNLALNARDAIAGEGTIQIEPQEVLGEDGEHFLVLSVADDGVGMAPQVLVRATEPFFTTKPANQGTGLGLAMVYSIMQGLGGRLELQSIPGAGTRVEMWFPVFSREAPIPSPLPPHTSLGDPPEEPVHLLLVEDEHAVRVATERTLRRLGYLVTSVANIKEASEVIARAPLDLVISDVMMPGGTGIDLLRSVRAQGNTLPFLFVSGYAMESLEGILEGDAGTEMLTKPWTVEELGERVRGMLQRHGRPAVVAEDGQSPSGGA